MTIDIPRLLDFYRKQDKVIFYCISTALSLIFTQLIIFAFKYQNLPSDLPLYYSSPWGEAQLSPRSGLWILPALSLLFILTNLLLTWYLHSSQTSIKRILALSTTVLSLLMFVAGIGIVSLFT